MKKGEEGMAALDAHLRQWQEISERVRTQLFPAVNLQEALQKSIQPTIEARETFQKALGAIFADQERCWQLLESIRIPQFDLPEISDFAKQAADLQRSIRELMATLGGTSCAIGLAFEQLHKTFRELPSRTQDALLLLGKHGWYLDLEMSVPALWELKYALSDGNVAEAEDALVEYFEGRTAEIEESITKRFPHRGHLIRAAFGAHRRQEYDLSIPVLLAQTDGICKEVLDQYLFMKRNRKPSTAIYVAQIASDTVRGALLSPLAQTLPIGASENERPLGFAALNRHTVLHGESLDYGSKSNSLKAISLINYVAQVLTFEQENALTSGGPVNSDLLPAHRPEVSHTGSFSGGDA